MLPKPPPLSKKRNCSDPSHHVHKTSGGILLCLAPWCWQQMLCGLWCVVQMVPNLYIFSFLVVSWNWDLWKLKYEFKTDIFSCCWEPAVVRWYHCHRGGWDGGGSLQNCLVDGVVYRPDIDMNHRTQGFLEVKWIDLIKFTYPVVLIAAVCLYDTWICLCEVSQTIIDLGSQTFV